MKYLVTSDSHMYQGNLIEVIKKVSPIAAMIHLGDMQCSLNELEKMVGCPVYAVAGNSDRSSELPEEQVITLEGHRIALCHGHKKSGVQIGMTFGLVSWGEEMDAEVVMFGHTHMPLLVFEKNMTIVNPGSISIPRQEPRIPTYTIMEIDKNSEIHFTMNEFHR